MVNNYYPPSKDGWGYMQLCEEVTNGLSARNHQVEVLTSFQQGVVEPQHRYPVHRVLPIDPDWSGEKSAARQFFFGRRQREQQSIVALQQVVSSLRPEVILIWHAIGLPRVLLQAIERIESAKTVYYLAGYLPELPDEYLAYWTNKPERWSARLFKNVLSKIAIQQLKREGKPVRLAYPNVICVSEYVRNRLVSQNLIPAGAVVIQNGVDLSHFSASEPRIAAGSRNLSCLIAGNIIPEKGIHTAIGAFEILKRSGKIGSLSLTVIGRGDAEYLSYLNGLVDQYALRDVVKFLPPAPREQMPDILRQYDILLLPSEYQEPLARSMQEAMAVGLLVIGTTTGGSGELLVHERTGFAFEAGNPQSLADQLLRAMTGPDLSAQIARTGQKTVCECYGIQRTITRIEAYLLGLVADG